MKRNNMFSQMLAVVAVAVFTISLSARASEADDRIEASFKKSYVYRTFLKDDSLNITAKNGAVTLSGTVAEESHKAMAQETAANLPGVTSVDNQLATTAEVAADNADTWMARKVKLTLMFHRNVSGWGTDVTVKDGEVTLKGEASSVAQKELTSEYAADIEGVKSVQNQMTVAETPVPTDRTAGEKVDDASVTAQVKLALLNHRSTSAIDTKVVTREGVVTLTGIAKNDAEKSLVTKLASDIKGVTNVNNKMTIAEATTN